VAAVCAVAALSADVALSAWIAVAAVLAVSARPAFVALLADVAVSAWLALGTVPSDDSLILAPVTAPFLIFVAVTAFFFSCSAPMLFFGSWVAA
jgi:hypothetical protein